MEFYHVNDKAKIFKNKVSVLEPNLIVNYLGEDANYFDKEATKNT